MDSPHSRGSGRQILSVDTIGVFRCCSMDLEATLAEPPHPKKKNRHSVRERSRGLLAARGCCSVGNILTSINGSWGVSLDESECLDWVRGYEYICERVNCVSEQVSVRA